MILHDLHLHTQYSDGRNTVGGMIHAAVAVGLPWIGFADHYDAACNRLVEQKAEIGRSPYVRRIHVLRGAEVKIRLDGTPAMADEVAASLDYVLLEPAMPELRNVPGGKRKTMAAAMRMLTRSAERARGAIYAHPFNFGRLRDDVALRDLDRHWLRGLARTFAERGHVFEIMNNIWYWYPRTVPDRFAGEYGEIIMLFADAGVAFSLGSDAHSLCGVGNLGWALKMARTCRVTARLIKIYPARNSPKISLPPPRPR